MESSNEYVLNMSKEFIESMTIFFDNKVCIVVADREKFLKIINNSDLNLNIYEGQPINSRLRKIADLGVSHSEFIDESVLGFPCNLYALPLKNESGELVGDIFLYKDDAVKKNLFKLSSNFTDSISSISTAVEESTTNIQDLSENRKDILVNVQKAVELTQDSASIIKFVQSIAKETNILGINASIEAARAGESGRGFNIVAQSIRRLSKSTNDSIKEINKVMKNIEESVQRITDKVKNSNEAFDTQVAALEEISASVQEVSNNAKQIEESTRDL